MYAVAITTSDKQYSRYLLPLLPLAALGLGVTATRSPSGWAPGGCGPTGWAGLAAAGVFTAALAPYAISFVDPLVGGQRQAEDAIQLGWGEAKEAVIADYERRTDAWVRAVVRRRAVVLGLPEAGLRLARPATPRATVRDDVHR